MHRLDIVELRDDEHLCALARKRQPFTLVLRNTAAEPLTEDQLVLATLAVANGGRLELDRKASMKPIPAITAGITFLGRPIFSLLPGDQRDAAYSAWNALVRREVQDALEGTVAAIFRRVEQAMPHAGKSGLQLGGAWEAQPYLFHFEGEIDLRMRYVFRIEQGVTDLGATLLLMTSRPYGKKLCKCQLPTCGLFFLERQGIGRPQRKYCCVEDMTTHHNSAVKRRTRTRTGLETPARHK